jgi:mediator of RNA polymerase II transcription subunit 13
MATSASLRGKSFQDVAGEIWERTVDIIAARDVTWRIFIVSDSEMDKSEAKCWRKLAATKTRKQMFVTLLSVQTETTLQLTQPSSLETANAPGNSGQFLTPGSTPQGAMTVSPDASGQAAPLTPAPMETTTSNPENDPDAHLIDIMDESWGMLLSPAFTSTLPHSHSEDRTSKTSTALAQGILFRRGTGHANAPPGKLESLGVNLHWDIRIRPNGAVDDGPPKQAEVTLREVLRMYRHLGLLGRARNLHSHGKVGAGQTGGKHLLPVHIASAARAAEALRWFRV